MVPSLWPKPPWSGEEATLRVEVAADNAVAVRLRRPSVAERGTLIFVHGLGGSADSHYVVSTARVALARGWNVARMNLRNCGGTIEWATTLYNAGQSDDLDKVLAALEGLPRPFVVVGFSLGGNLSLRYAGASGDGSRADRFVGVSVPVDLEACLQAMEQPGNRIYDLFFTRKLCRQLHDVERRRPLPGPAQPRWWRIRALRQLDTLYTAPDAGYPSAEAYYADASAAPLLPAARRPILMLSAANDPVIPAAILEAHRGPYRLALSSRGGHCGFWRPASGATGQGQAGQPASTRRFWAAESILEFAEG